MSKKKSSRIHKKKRLHPILKMLMGLFVLVVIGVVITASAYKDVSPMQEVAGASTDVFRNPSVTPTQSSCTIVTGVVGISPCGRDSYRGVTFTCGDGTSPKPTVTPTLGVSPTPGLTTNGSCRSIVAWMTKVAQVCAGHSSCRPTVTPTISPRPHPSTFPTPHPTFKIGSEGDRQNTNR